MLRDQDIVVFGEDLGRHPHCLEHIMKNLWHENRVLWVETYGLRWPRLTRYDMKRAWEIIKKWRSSSPPRKPVAPEVEVVAPIILPFGSSFRWLNRFFVLRAVRQKMQALGMKRPLIIASVPQACDYVEDLEGRCVVYYRVDDFSLWPGNSGKRVSQMDLKLTAQCDIFMATAGRLLEIAKDKPRRYLLTHGVDIEHFRLPERPLEQDHPVIGYYGLIDQRCDQELLAQIARSFPQARVKIIGHVAVETTALSMPNIEFVGMVPYESLPQHLAEVDVLVLPYKLDELTQTINPLKLKEYLATGRPVVSTPLLEVQRVSQYLWPVEGAQEFIEVIERLLSGDLVHDPAPVWDYLNSGETWRSKALKFSGWVNDYSET
jgi:glycosyltransferase involved in cell wall biosynthesis